MCAHPKKHDTPAPGEQRGVVLLLTLIMLVAMTLAGIGMMRSVDTGNVVAGNLAFKQSTTYAADGGTSTGFNALMTLANSGTAGDKLILSYNPGQPCPPGMSASTQATYCPAGVIVFPGYLSTPINACEVTNTCGAATPPGCPAGTTYANWYNCAASWNGAPSFNIAATGTTVSYLIHRMCATANTVPTFDPAVNTCQAYTPPSIGKGQNMIPGIPSFYYRITARSVGPRNTVTYTQALVLIAI